MVIKAVELVREIRNKNYEETRNLSIDDQIRFIREKAKKLQKSLENKGELIIQSESRVR